MKIPFVSLNKQYKSIKEEIDLAISDVINETAFIGGKHVNTFENTFAHMNNIKHCISVANGTDSLYIIMKMLGIGKGDQVITVANSWISSSETITQTGATPVFIDIDEYFTINTLLLEKEINRNTKAIIVVHLYGQMCDMDELIRISRKYSIPIIEDCAQSHFSEYKGKLAGTIGVASSFSFYPGKNLGAYGDAGCILTNDDELAIKFRMYSKHGALKKHQHKIEGINSRLDGLQASILNVKLKYILKWNDLRRKNAQQYNLLLSKLKKYVEVPTVRYDTKHSFHLYVIKCEMRDQLAEYLNINGIETAIHYPTPLPLLECYDYLNFDKNKFSVSIENMNKILSLPMYPELEESEIIFICSKIEEFYKNL